jgi:hypothetical protein
MNKAPKKPSHSIRKPSQSSTQESRHLKCQVTPFGKVPWNVPRSTDVDVPLSEPVLKFSLSIGQRVCARGAPLRLRRIPTPKV